MRQTMSALAATLCLLGAPLAAQDTVLWKSIGDWDISIDTTIGDGCFAIATWDGGTILRIGLNPKLDNFYFLIGNEKWASLQPEKDYDIQIKFGSRASWDVSARGLQLDPDDLVFLHAQSTQSDFISEFQRALNMEIRYDGNEIDNLKLTGSRKAWDAVEACQDEVKTRGSGDDPFASSAGSAPSADRSGRKSEDPFAD